MTPAAPRVALVWHGDRDARDGAKLSEHRLGPTAQALRGAGLEPEAAVTNDDFADEVREQLLKVDAALVWVNPIEQGRDRTKLDAVLKEVADAGVLVSAHPATIRKMGTKEVLFQTRAMGWGSDVRLYRTLDELRRELPLRLAEGKPRVLKQYRGHSGNGVWKVTPIPGDRARVKARHAARGSVEQEVALEELIANTAVYFAGDGRIIDQPFQERIADGTVRCYLVQDRVQGFGHQEVNALFPKKESDPQEEAPGPRLYCPSDDPRFQSLRRRLEDEWLGEMLTVLGMRLDELPLLWDADFMFGPKTPTGEDTYVLCEINVSSVYPYPEHCMRPMAEALSAKLKARRTVTKGGA